MLKLITAATSKPVSLAELKAHVKAADFTSDDDELEIFLDAAAKFVGERTSLTLQPSSWRIDRCDWWSGCLQVLLAPVRDIVITYLDEAGAPQTVNEALYRWERTDKGTAEIRFLSDFTSPAVKADTFNAVQIAIEAGFDNAAATGAGDDPELVLPPTAKQAILMLAAAWYRNREAVADADFKVVPLAADALIWQLRVYR